MQNPPESATAGPPAKGHRPPIEAVDSNPSVRPGVPEEREPKPWPNARLPPERMTAAPSVPTHGRPHKRPPPVYGTAVPLHGVSGVVRRAAYRYPDHVPAHWLLLLAGDRLDAWGTRARRWGRFAAPIGLAAFAGARAWRRLRSR